MSTVSTEKMMAQIACKAIDDKKGQDIKIIDIHNVSVIADYFVIASGTNSNQVQAIVDNVEEQLGRAGFEAKQIEGNRNSSWILMDYGDVIVMKRTGFSMIWRESGEMERFWRWMRF